MCEWTEHIPGRFETECGERFIFTTFLSWKFLNFSFCPFCGDLIDPELKPRFEHMTEEELEAALEAQQFNVEGD